MHELSTGNHEQAIRKDSRTKPSEIYLDESHVEAKPTADLIGFTYESSNNDDE